MAHSDRSSTVAALDPDAAADQLRAAMVDRLHRLDMLQTAEVEAAMRAVPRHRFLPGSDLDDAYVDDAVVTHRDAAGVAVSSASAPSMVAGMLEQLEVRPGHRVLEIGAGTGYNAALLAELAGPDGAVTTVEVHPGVAAAADRALHATGHGTVRVVAGDGEFGYTADAPYDRIVVTAGAWDVPPAWWDQLAPGGRLLAPLRIRGVTLAVALDEDAGALRSRSTAACGFIPIRGAGGVAEQNITVHATEPGATTSAGDAGPGVALRIDSDQTGDRTGGRAGGRAGAGGPVDPAAFEGALAVPVEPVWTGATTSGYRLASLDLWLATLDGFCRVMPTGDPGEAGLTPPLNCWGSMGAHSEHGFAYLTSRPVGADGDGGAGGALELGVCGYGRDAGPLVNAMADRVRGWGEHDAGRATIRVEVHRRQGGVVEAPEAWLVVPKRHTSVLVYLDGLA